MLLKLFLVPCSKTCFLLGLFLVFSRLIFGQTVIAQQDFEITPANPEWTIISGNSFISATTGVGETPSGQRIRTGTQSWQVRNPATPATLNLEAVSVSCFNSVQVIVYISSTSITSGNGADIFDELKVFTDLDGSGFPVVADITVTGNTNARWGYNTSGITTTAGTPVTVNGTSGTNLGTIYSKLVINIPNGTSTVALQITADNSDDNEIWNVDDIQIIGTASVFAGPTATAGTVVSGNGFTANWTSVAGATGYFVDVYTKSTVSASLSEGFDNGISAPAGWTFTNIGSTYTTTSNFGLSSPSLRLDATGDQIVTETLSAAATSLSFWIKGQSTNSVSALLVEGFNGTAWVPIQNITASLPTTGTTFTYTASSTPALPAGITRFRFTYTQGSGNLSFDDVSIQYPKTINVSVPGWENVFTPSNVLEVTGLNESTTYYYVVRTDNGCISSNSNEIAVTTSPPCTPTASITSFSPSSAASGSSVTITGSGFTGATDVSFGGIAASFTIIDNTTITAIIPALASTNKIRVTVGGCPAVSSTNFVVQQLNNQSIQIITQFVNPCGFDANNEFIIARTYANTVNIGNLALTASNGSNINWYWYGKNVPTNPYTNSVFSSGAPEVCGTSFSLQCFRLMDPGNAADATVITNVINQLNGIAGCNVFLPVPLSGDIPPQSNVIFLLAGGGCGFDNPSSYMNFLNHCQSGTPITQYFVVVGTGNFGCGGNGYFSNDQSRISTLFNYMGGDNTVSTNYQSQISAYTTPPILTKTENTLGGRAAVFVPDGKGGSKWVSNNGCIPLPSILLSEIKFEFYILRKQEDLDLRWIFKAGEPIKEFIIEKSSNMETFKQIVTIPINQYNHAELELHYKDVQLQAGEQYYRVKAISQKGTIYFSSICRTMDNQISPTVRIFPNPFTSLLYVNFQTRGILSYEIINTSGFTLQRGTLTGQTKKIETNMLKSGIYFIRFMDDSGLLLHAEKLYKQ